tara:strand:- start:87 stop:194 length:108 start_codon:yes stop_codon:yes gene_type:complete
MKVLSIVLLICFSVGAIAEEEQLPERQKRQKEVWA